MHLSPRTSKFVLYFQNNIGKGRNAIILCSSPNSKQLFHQNIMKELKGSKELKDLNELKQLNESNVLKELKEPKEMKQSTISKESPTISYIRNVITIIVIGSILSLGYPLFLLTTTIYRADLPIDRINNYDVNSVNFQIPIEVNGFQVNKEYLRAELNKWYPDVARTWSLVFPDEKEYNDAKHNDDNSVDMYSVELHETSSEKHFKIKKRKIDVYFSTAESNTNQYLLEILFKNVFKSELETLSALVQDKVDSSVAFPYSKQYNLMFSLFVEDGKQLNWEIEEALLDFQPVLNLLHNITSFKTSTQIQYYSLLSKSYPMGMIPQDELSTFINFGDWNLGNFDMNPTINFIVYVPKEQLGVENSATNSFLISKWGGVQILNRMPGMAHSTISKLELTPILNIFANQLFQLLNIDQYNSKVSHNQNMSLEIKLDSLKRITIYKNINNSLANLRSLVKLLESLKDITVPEETKQNVLKSLDAMDEAKRKKSVLVSANALDASNAAFFEKKMVQQAYFPSEHKMAVFLPLLGPIGSIIVFNILRLVKKSKL